MKPVSHYFCAPPCKRRSRSPSAWLGLHYATVAKLAAFVGGCEREVIAAAESALKILAVTHGSGAWGPAGRQICAQVERVQWEALQELRAATS